ncbi:hypothetical protein [Paenibacillus contaminans]|uniref:hypothetical protein n=1 Tax=Paenibacillus contaminans TaxID=450362 RepID=UPI001314EA33|nr:hypothetical protein [Paenibacillus contaminans]
MSDHILEAVMKKCFIRWLPGAAGTFLYPRMPSCFRISGGRWIERSPIGCKRVME